MEVEAKPPSFVPMPQHALPFQPHAVQIVLWRAPEAEAAGADVHSFFPNRDLNGMNLQRRREHHAVQRALSTLLQHDAWQVSHDANGKPWLHLEGQEAPTGLSITHCDVDNEVWAAVAVPSSGQPTGGIDLTPMDDPRLKRVAHRVMSTEEQARWAGREAWAWATKEAMFKGHGPALAFATEALLLDCTGLEGGSHGEISGRVRGRAWNGIWAVMEGRVLLVWGH